MRIAIMARAYGEKGGIGVYTRNVIRELLRYDRDNQYFIYYSEPRFVGTHAAPNVTERALPSPHRIWWDQISVARAARRDAVDLIFHTKFSVPLLARAKRIMVVHGAGWLLPDYEHVFSKTDVTYIKLAMPRYFKACSKVLSVSHFSSTSYATAIPRYKDRLATIYFAPNQAFKPIDDAQRLKEVRDRYQLPKEFLLTVIRYDHNKPNTRKNPGNMLQAFALLKKKYHLPHKLVMAGKDCEQYGIEHRIHELGIGDDVIFPGLVRQDDLPAFYNLASLFLYPTLLEAFPVPITEALSCGTPIVTSTGTGLEELTQDAGLKVDPRDPVAIAEAAHRVLCNSALARSLRARGLERARIFSWERCAQETIELFHSVVGSPPAPVLDGAAVRDECYEFSAL